MKTKLLAIMLLAGGSMFAQARFSIGIGFGGHGFYQPPPSYPSNGHRNGQSFSSGDQFATRYDNRFNDGDDRQSITHGFEQDRNRGFGQGRNSSGQNRDQTRGFNQGHARDSEQNQNQNHNRGNRNRSDNQDNAMETVTRTDSDAARHNR